MMAIESKLIKLSEVCQIESGAGFPTAYQGQSNNQYPFFKVGDMNLPGNEREMKQHRHTISEEIRKQLNAIAFPPGTVIFPKIGAAIATNKKRILAKTSCIDNNIMALVPRIGVTTYYLYYLLVHTNLSDFASRGNPPSIRKSTIQNWKLSLPPLTEQKSIAAILRKADRLRRLRRYACKLSDTFLQSVFLEMFGDFDHVNVLTIQKLMDDGLIIKMQDGNHGGDYPRTSEFVSQGIPFLTATNVINGQVHLEEAPRLQTERAEKLRIGWVQPNDVLLAHNATVGRVAIMPRFPGKVVLGTSLTYYRLDSERLLPEFLAQVFRSQFFQSQLDQTMKQTTRNQVPITRQRLLLVPDPPTLQEQENFAKVVRHYERLRFKQMEGLRQAEQLFQSLLNQAFRGEL